MYSEYIKTVMLPKFKGKSFKDLEEMMYELEEHVLNLMNDVDVCQFIKINWLDRMCNNGKPFNLEFGQTFDTKRVIDKVKAALEDKEGKEFKIPPGTKMSVFDYLAHESENKEVKKDIGAVKLWKEFESWEEDRETCIYLYVKSFCGIRTSGDLLVIKPKNHHNGLSKAENMGESVGLSLIGQIFDVTGLSWAKKFDEWDEKKAFERKLRLYKELRQDIDFNPLDEIMKQKRFQKIRESTIQELQQALKK